MNDYNLTTDGELYHYGVKGMKWGVRRFQKKDGSLTPAGKKRYDKDGSSSDAENETGTKRKGLTSKQKKIIAIGAAAVGTALIAYGGYKVSQMYKGVGTKIDPETGLRLLSKPEDDATCVRKINPGRIKFLSRTKNVEIINGSSQNCMLCTTTYELRKRGFDVRSGRSKTGFMPDDLFPELFLDYKGTDKISPKLSSIEDYVKMQGNGSRGNIIVWWKMGMGGHSMIWENSNGNVKFMDGQTGEVIKDFKKYLNFVDGTKSIEMLRTDNLKVDYKSIKNFVNNEPLTKTIVDHSGEIALKFATNPLVATTTGMTAYAGTKIADRINEWRENKESISETKTEPKGGT